MTVLTSIIAANVLIFLFGMFSTGGDFIRYQREFLSSWWKDNGGLIDGEYYRLLSSMFLHANFLHLAINMWSLFRVGQSAILIFGTTFFFIIYLLSGITGTFVSWRLNPNPSVSSTNVVFGLLGAIFSFALLTSSYELVMSIIIVLLINAVLTYFIPAIDNSGYVGGFIGGFTSGLIITMAALA